jgi:hypothetical protein
LCGLHKCLLDRDAIDQRRDRATLRMFGGELLAQMKAKPAGNPKTNRAGAHPISQTKAAKKAGLSPHQAKQMVRIASVPEKQFELLAQMKAKPGGDRKSKGRHPPVDRSKTKEGARPSSRKQAAKKAGLSPRR